MNIKKQNSTITTKQLIIGSVIGLMCIYIFVNYMFVSALKITFDTSEEIITSDSMTYLKYTFGNGSYINAKKIYLILIPIIGIIIGLIEFLINNKKAKIIINLCLAVVGGMLSGFAWLDLSKQVSSEIFSNGGYYGTLPNVGWYLSLGFFALIAIIEAARLMLSIPKDVKKKNEEFAEETKKEANEVKQIIEEKINNSKEEEKTEEVEVATEESQNQDATNNTNEENK